MFFYVNYIYIFIFIIIFPIFSLHMTNQCFAGWKLGVSLRTPCSRAPTKHYFFFLTKSSYSHTWAQSLPSIPHFGRRANTHINDELLSCHTSIYIDGKPTWLQFIFFSCDLKINRSLVFWSVFFRCDMTLNSSSYHALIFSLWILFIYLCLPVSHTQTLAAFKECISSFAGKLQG